MNMSKYRFIAVAVTLLLCLTLSATNVRGYVQGYNPFSNVYFPRMGVKLSLWITDGASWFPVATTYSGADGMYYFFNLQPGLIYHLQINDGQTYPLQILNLQVQDIPPITF